MTAAPAPGARVGHRLNQALHTLFAADERLFLLGQDIADPYGGAFGITRGLSSRYPGRVWSTPISEEATVGVAAGLALCGDRAVVEVMFGDFITLCVDPLINFAAKSVTMYGRRLPMSLVVRCPVGGNRGYGPTHSQNLQKHLIGVPDLTLYELTPFGDPVEVLRRMLDDRQPGVLFEDKSLYPAAGYDDGVVDDVFGYRFLDRAAGTVLVSADGADPDCVLVAPGGLTLRALSAMRRALLDHDVLSQLVVPTRLYPLDLDPILELAARAGRVVVAEDGVGGGNWGSELSRQLYERLWLRLSHPVRLVHAAPAVIPAAPHLERSALVQDSTIFEALMEPADG
jgi:pyruvate dehydrogenase E1 component beta subunit